ncbi:RNA polymerase sigma factor [Novipirellula artificiosorum]|uniref:ECF RNA polymerase sigma factor SigL n=1 Tax=Novipirellula artificiosorum TaxID=2528016 RepID=A0A5C6DDK0_9BACT|nr:sigma-70 family RNA polymerase sigma factor [Novipirellula artificiosorum]TWU32989.1 ECF RNA polymerase sigma factor SigL [Novipirellula artificiosorum]
MATFDSFSDQVRRRAERIAESSAAALAGLYDLTAQRLVRYATTITANQHDAEDAVSAALVRVAREPRLLCRAERPWAYLLRMVRNESLLILRKKKRWSLLGDLSDLLTRRSSDPIEIEDQQRAVWSALRSLPTEQSEVVVLKIWEDMTFAQISEVLEVSPSTAASRYRYAIEKLSGKLRSSDAEVIHE